MEDTQANMFDSRTLAMGLAGIRLGIGGALVLAPQFAARVWVGPGAEGAGTRVLARALGARDVVLGYRTLQAARNGEPTGGWLQLGAMADAADAVAGLIAYRGIPGHRRFTMPLVAAVMGSVCFWAARPGGSSGQEAAETEDPAVDRLREANGEVIDLDGRDASTVGDRDDLDDHAVAALLEVTVDRIDVLVADGVLTPVATNPRRFRRSEVLAARMAGA